MLGKRMVIFELDGGTWRVADPLMRQGLLPNLSSLVTRGARGILRSVYPMISPALWTTIYTGQPREAHGVMTFDATSNSVSYWRLWDIAHAYGASCGICGSMVTWPPYDVGGFMIPDIMARDAQTIPPSVSAIQELVIRYPTRGRGRIQGGLGTYPRYAFRLMRAGVTWRTLGALAMETITAVLWHRSHRSSYWRRALLMQELYTDAFVTLYRNTRPRLATYHYHAVDTLSHWYWVQDGTEPDSTIVARHRHAVVDAYQAADRALGKLLGVVGEDATVLVLSDHGFRRNPDDRPRYRVRLPNLIQILGLEGRVMPTRLAHQHFLYFSDDTRLQEVANVLRESHVKDTGAPVFPRVVVRDQSVFFPPPIIRLDGKTVVVPGYAELPAEELVDDTGQIETGIHDLEGMVVLAGPAIKSGIEIGEADILDVMPNLLFLLDLPVGRDMGGRIWHEVLTHDFEQGTDLTYVDTYRRDRGSSIEDTAADAGDDSEIIYQRLRDLGYL